ncbi:hypothetical protein [Novosphingobium lentum]|uniref:hypothetical protein n=1 Tax=Novosphingobium lentum TaxID=145287 RepID=UPI00082BD754|nr:hypothetical protein [Novosphingobium lentum]
MAEHDFEKMALTPLDEYPFHATPYPMSYIPNSDPAWDDGYYFLAYDLDTGASVWTGMRIAPNSNMIGGYANTNVRGVQRAVRLSRIWRPDFDVAVGPLRFEFVEPLKAIRLICEPNESGIAFDILWRGLSPCHLAAHHRAVRAGRLATDQSRYHQVGQATGWMQVGDQRWDMPEDAPWGGSRDRSWGIYESRPPLAAAPKFLPPVEPAGTPRALRFSCFVECENLSAYFHFHEGPNGERDGLNDAFGIPLEGSVDFGWPGDEGHREKIAFTDYDHKLNWRPGTRSVTDGTVTLTDANGSQWSLALDVRHPPHVLGQIGYHVGAWSDGGTIHTWHGRSPALEWDEFDFSQQPCQHTFPGNGETRTVFGVEHLAAVTLTAPDGTVHNGRAQFEVFLNGRYAPYGFEGQENHGGLTGRGIA